LSIRWAHLTALLARMTDTTIARAVQSARRGCRNRDHDRPCEDRVAPQEGRSSLRKLLGIGTGLKANARISAALRLMRDEPHNAHGWA